MKKVKTLLKVFISILIYPFYNKTKKGHDENGVIDSVFMLNLGRIRNKNNKK